MERTHRSCCGINIDDKLAIQYRVRVVVLCSVLMREGEVVVLVNLVFAVDLRGMG